MLNTATRTTRRGIGYGQPARHILGTLILLTTVNVVRVDLGAQAENVLVRGSAALPTQEISDAWDRGWHITSVTGTSHGYWAVVMSSRSGYASQAHSGATTSWPRDFIANERDAGRRITEVAYSNGRWLVVTSGGLDWPQTWATTSSLSAKMRGFRNLDYHITDVAYGGGLWAVVASQVPSFGHQVYTESSAFPSAFIREKWDDGYRITEWYYGNNTWVVVMTKLASKPIQRYASWQSFEDARSEGLEILDIVYTGNSYSFTATDSLGEVMGFPPPSGGVLESNVTGFTSRSATFTLDVFVVGSDSELLTLTDTDFLLDDAELAKYGTHLNYSLNSVQRYRQRSAGPYSAAFLLDQSGSIRSTDPTDARIDAAKVFIRSLGSGDEVGLMAFASNGRLPHSPVTTWLHGGQRFSSSSSAFFGALNGLADLEDGGTPLYDASRTAVSYTSTHANNSNKVVIVFTDGEDTASSATLGSAIQYAKQLNIPLHTVALSRGVDIGVLSRMAAETGGSLTYATDARRLISYYGALGPYLSGTGTFYRTTWSLLARGGSFNFSRGSSIYDYIEIEIPGSNIHLPFRLSF